MMVFPLLQRQTYFIIVASILGLLLLCACGSNTASSANTNTNITAHTAASTAIVSTAVPTQKTISPATATASVVIKLIALIGQPKAKMLAGTTFEVDGMVKNGDSKQHDIFLQATLFDASGAKIASSVVQNVDNVKGGTTVPYSIQGSTTQPTWTRIQVTIIKVTENSGSSGSD